MDFQPAGLSFGPPETPAAPEIQVQFNLAQGRAEITNEWGLSPTDETYDDLITRAFDALDTLPDLPTEAQIEPILTDFLSAAYQDKLRHEAYLGLGYACAMVGFFPRALKYLDVAFQLTNDPDIGELMRQVRAKQHAARLWS